MSTIEYVRCNCFFKENLSKTFEFINYVKFIDNDFELELPDEIKQNKPLKEKIYSEFYDWLEFPCKHENGRYYSCILGGGFQHYLRLLKNTADYPTLSSQLDDFNDKPFIPVSYNTQLRKEAAEFMKLEITTYNLISKTSISWGHYYRYYEVAENIDELLCENGNEKLYTCNNSFRIEKNNEIIFQSSEFTVERIINRRFIFTDKNKKVETTIFFDLDLFKNGNKQRLLYEKNTYKMQDELQYAYEKLMNLLNASDATGNPISWY